MRVWSSCRIPGDYVSILWRITDEVVSEADDTLFTMILDILKGRNDGNRCGTN